LVQITKRGRVSTFDINKIFLPRNRNEEHHS
jgi:hypothetical protein